MFDKRMVAHMSVLSAACSPCGGYFAFGTNLGLIYVFSLESSDEDSPSFAVSVISKLPYPGGIYALLTTGNRLYAASVGYVANISWENLIAGRTDFDVIHLPISRRALDLPEVNSLAILESSNVLYAACGDGSIASIPLNASALSTGCFKAHDNSVYSISKAGDHELLSCSEDGRACFWDIRSTHTNAFPCQKFVPSEQSGLIRKSVGSWLTVATIQEDDLDWFILGGGPKMSLWNRRASYYTAIFEPARDSEFWFPHVCKFIGNQTEPKIVAGGTSSCLLTWDHTGEMLAETNLGTDPATRLLHVLTVTEVSSSSDAVNGCLIAGGLGPALHFVSRLGYSLKHLPLSNAVS